MNVDRSRAYSGLMATIRGYPDELEHAERERLVDAADTLVFARSWDESEVRSTLQDFPRLCAALLERWPMELVDDLTVRLLGCGPDANGLAPGRSDLFRLRRTPGTFA